MQTTKLGERCRNSAIAMRRETSQRLVREIVFFSIALAIVTVDQVTKLLVKSNMSLGQSVPESGFFRLTYATNTGGAFGIFANQTLLIILIAIAGVVTILIYMRYAPLDRVPLRAGLALLLGGTVGNLIDRLAFGKVVDFIDVGVAQYRWPAFNVADSAITVGVILIAYFVLFQFGRQGPARDGSG